jgi:hypothetical protein
MENGELFSDAHLLRYLRLRRDAKGKSIVSSDSKLIGIAD